MTKASVIAFLFFAICILSSLNFASDAGTASQPRKFIVVGHVYCDTCRVEFETKISQKVRGAIVKLECQNRSDRTSTFQSPEIVTDCNDMTEQWRKARVVLTKLDGVSGNIRYANNLGFKKKEALPECKQVLTEMGYYELRDELGNEAVA
ncbi:hypothetical protein F3Y22_tig00110865pilonHSYRG00132 [Hibiscus syriacus]|uniref:Alg9-like mannosyltransferase family n=1 Tax=Hibiscus syriacus TaxID=106335 RepID=A0A6A2ZLQ0_HIBSY|nr:hypothetical protein F3Y22_tig00110865pilonHSYRG00132 [Hibiscus syriacus]